jgi:hypothetical protein
LGQHRLDSRPIVAAELQRPKGAAEAATLAWPNRGWSCALTAPSSADRSSSACWIDAPDIGTSRVKGIR